MAYVCSSDLRNTRPRMHTAAINTRIRCCSTHHAHGCISNTYCEIRAMPRPATKSRTVQLRVRSIVRRGMMFRMFPREGTVRPVRHWALRSEIRRPAPTGYDVQTAIVREGDQAQVLQG